MENYDQGLTRNIRRLFGVNEMFAGMDRPLSAVVLRDDKSAIRFEFMDGSSVRFGVEGDCCSSSWIEHLEMPDDIAGQTITEVFDDRIEQQDQEYGLLQVYHTRFRTPKGDIVLEYRNESNGYYGGYLVRLGEEAYRQTRRLREGREPVPAKPDWFWVVEVNRGDFWEILFSYDVRRDARRSARSVRKTLPGSYKLRVVKRAY